MTDQLDHGERRKAHTPQQFVSPAKPDRGQALVTMLSTDAGMAQSDVAKATAEVTSRRAQAQYAASAHARAERLLAIKAIPRGPKGKMMSASKSNPPAKKQPAAAKRQSRVTSLNA